MRLGFRFWLTWNHFLGRGALPERFSTVPEVFLRLFDSGGTGSKSDGRRRRTPKYSRGRLWHIFCNRSRSNKPPPQGGGSITLCLPLAPIPRLAAGAFYIT